MANNRKPDNVHRLNGTYAVTRHGNPDDKPDWSTDFPDMPDCVASNEGAKKEWNRILAEAPSGVITRTDLPLLALHCVTWAAFDKDPDSFLAADKTQMRLTEKELGFTPVSRGSIGGAKKGGGADGPVTIRR